MKKRIKLNTQKIIKFIHQNNWFPKKYKSCQENPLSENQRFLHIFDSGKEKQF